jgi:glyoxylase-like metal-dependent hydrolase (beta-lactamase superfamily II)
MSATYTGEVAVGGPADVRELPGLTIAKLAVGKFNNNAYLLRCKATGEALLVDAAAETDNLLGLISTGGPRATSVLTTHRHFDHWQVLDEVIALTGMRTLAGVDDAEGITVATERLVAHGDTVHVGDIELRAIELRGHTPGSIALHYQDPSGFGHLFTGDSLFPGGVGKTNDPESFTSLMDDVMSRLFDVYDDDTWFYPGHGFDSTLGAERPHLDEWRNRGW